MFNFQKYKISTYKLFLNIVPRFWIYNEDNSLKTVWVSYLRLIAGMLNYAAGIIGSNAEFLYNFLLPTGQHLSLENYLNNRFDNDSRRIEIIENDSWNNYVWYKDGEEDPQSKIWYTDADTNLLVTNRFYTDADTNVINTEFTVRLPSELSYLQGQMTDFINRYVVNGYTYNYNYI